MKIILLSMFLVLSKPLSTLHKVRCILLPWNMDYFILIWGDIANRSLLITIHLLLDPFFSVFESKINSHSPLPAPAPATLNKRSFPCFYLWLHVQESLCLEGISLPSPSICVNVLSFLQISYQLPFGKLSLNISLHTLSLSVSPPPSLTHTAQVFFFKKKKTMSLSPLTCYCCSCRGSPRKKTPQTSLNLFTDITECPKLSSEFFLIAFKVHLKLIQHLYFENKPWGRINL